MAEAAPSPVEIADSQPAELALPVPFCPNTQPAMEALSMPEAAESDAGPALLAPVPAGAEACGHEEVSGDSETSEKASGDSETQIVPADHGANKGENQEDQAMVAEGMSTAEWDATEDDEGCVQRMSTGCFHCGDRGAHCDRALVQKLQQPGDLASPEHGMATREVQPVDFGAAAELLQTSLLNEI